MKSISESKGFTIIELLVTINIAFLVIFFIITFYIFISKYSLGIMNNLELKSKSFLFLSKSNSILKKCDYFLIYAYNDSLIINTSDNHNIFFSIDNCKIDGIEMDFNLDQAQFKFFKDNEEILGYNLDARIKNENQEITLNSKELNEISIMSIMNGRIYQISYYKDDVSSKRFKNI
ncbi:MAG TPA: hypothetical protein VK250_05160 [Nitrososphaeraceae archaeon]|nr:hypothetical protein [Nitrososphaeraceae archaeon]